MSTKSISIFTEKIFELQEALEKGKDEFRKVFQENQLSLHNCSTGNSYMKQALEKVCFEAIEKYI